MATPTGGGFGRDSVEFGRVLTFSDGMFAIAMTLLVVGIQVPQIADEESVSALWDAVSDLDSSFISFFVSFLVIGRYWIAHHQFFSLLDRMDRGLIWLNLIYLAFIAFLPFPTALLGSFFANPLAFTIYACAVAVVSGMEVVMFRHAQRMALMRRQMPDGVYRWAAMLSLSPVFYFLASIPVAFAVGSGAALAVWLVGIPFQAFAGRHKPEDADAYLSGA